MEILLAPGFARSILPASGSIARPLGPFTVAPVVLRSPPPPLSSRLV